MVVTEVTVVTDNLAGPSDRPSRWATPAVVPVRAVWEEPAGTVLITAETWGTDADLIESDAAGGAGGAGGTGGDGSCGFGSTDVASGGDAGGGPGGDGTTASGSNCSGAGGGHRWRNRRPESSSFPTKAPVQ